MTLREMAEKLDLTELTSGLNEEQTREVAGGHVSDLLSDVLTNAPRGGVLVTIQAHLNVVAVAAHAELAAVVFSSNRKPEEAVIRKAVEERLPLFMSKQTSFDVAGRLYELGVRGKPA